jgi:hypothetical protein
MNWIFLAQDRAQWRIVVITVMNLRVPGNSLVAEELAASQESLSFMKIVVHRCDP